MSLEQLEFDLVFAHQRQLLRLDEVAKELSISDEQVRALIDLGRLEATLVNRELNSERRHLRVIRSSVTRFLLEGNKKIAEG